MSSRAGGLLELVARGKKDVFFTANPLVSAFHSVYTRAAPFTKEIYVAKPRNVPEWGRWVDFDIEHRGDLMKNTYLRIDLPSWLPPDVRTINESGIVTDASGVTFGYCNNVGFQMLEKIQLFNDQVLICETYGEYLDWRLRQSYPTAATYALNADVGARDETSLGIGRSASQRSLRVPIPLLGWQHLTDPGLPIVALRGCRLRMRVYLRRLEEIVVASDGRLNPKPWGGVPLLVQATRTGPVTTDKYTLPYEAMREIGIALESTQVYVPADVSLWMRAQTIQIPFINVQHHTYHIEDNQMTAAASFVETFSYPMPIDFTGSISILLLGFRTEASMLAGQRTNYRPPPDGTKFIRNARLNIANIDRLRNWPSEVYRDVASYWKNCRGALESTHTDVLQEVYTLTFGGFDHGGPSGTISFVRAVLPTLYLTLNSIPYDERNISRKTFAMLYGESWNIYSISGGAGKILFDE